MPNGYDITGPALKISLAAGPVFLALALLLAGQEMAGAPIELMPQDLVGALIIGGMATAVGLVIAFPVNWFVARCLLFLSEISFVFRPMVVWVAVAASLALGFCYLVLDAFANAGVYAFCGTAMICAAFVHHRLDWE